jgi:nucleoside phosphorylase
MSRFTDALTAPRTGPPPPMPVVDWARIGQSAPTVLPITYGGPTAPLPHADVVVMTWTTAEWSAVDQVFLDSSTAREPGSNEFERAWHTYLYARDVASFETDNPTNPLWGYYRLVEISTADRGQVTVLLFKCGAHLAHPPWIAGLTQMVTQIIQDAQPTTLYSIGTAGGARPTERLGDVVITDSAHIELKNPDNASSPLGGQTITSHTALTTGPLLSQAQASLMFALDRAVSYPVLSRMLTQLATTVPAAAGLTVGDLVNDALDPTHLGSPQALAMPGVPLLTTDYYFIATGGDSAQYCALEMDDGVVGATAAQLNTAYVFVRNISDPLVPDTTAAGAAIDPAVRDGWSSAIYTEFGIYSSFNGALATWAMIAGTGA